MATRRRRPRFRSQTMAIVIGGALFAGGAYCLWDAWEGRGQDTPRILRPITFW